MNSTGNLSNNIDIKAYNLLKVYNRLRDSCGLTKTQIAQSSGLSFSSVSNICTTLVSDNLISITENISPSGGRRAAVVNFLDNYGYSIVIDLHHSKYASVGILNLRNKLKTFEEFPIDAEEDSLESVIHKIKRVSDRLTKTVKGKRIGICVGCVGVINRNSGTVIESNCKLLDGMNLRRYISEIFPDELVLVENDANLSCLSQINRFDGRNKSLLLIQIVQSVGLGIGINGDVFRGANGFAGEIEGNRLFESAIGSRFLYKLITLDSIAQDLGEKISFETQMEAILYCNDLASRYNKGEKKVIARIDIASDMLGEICSELNNLFDPNAIAICGDLSGLSQQMLPIIRQKCRGFSKYSYYSDLDVYFLQNPIRELIYQGGAELVFDYWARNYFYSSSPFYTT